MPAVGWVDGEERIWWMSRTKSFRAVKMLCGFMVLGKWKCSVDSWYYTFDQIHRMYNIKSEWWGKLWTLGEYGVSLQVHELQKCITLVRGVHNWGDTASIVTRSIWRNVCTFLSILLWIWNFCKRITVKKKKVILKKKSHLKKKEKTKTRISSLKKESITALSS